MSTARATDGIVDAQGRGIGFGDYGDPGGAPVLFLHGLGDSRLTRPPDDERTAALGVRLLTVDAPGIGLSERVHVRSQVEAADRVLPVLDALGIERCAVLGWSAGGPRALAFAYRRPDRVTVVGLASGFGPLERSEFRADAVPRIRQGATLLRAAPFLARAFARPLPRAYREDPRRAFERQFGAHASAADRALLDRPDVAAVILAGAQEAVRQGSAGLAQEMQLLLARRWGFRPEDVDVPVHLWYGTEDRIVSPATGRRLAALLPSASLTEFDGEGHMALFAHWPEILRTLTSRSPS
jgi:pimeloyl-ACP methyl ester carboxylesterase